MLRAQAQVAWLVRKANSLLEKVWHYVDFLLRRELASSISGAASSYS
jgi:hypothetical protein